MGTILLRIILYVSWFGIGVATYLAFVNIRESLHTSAHKRALNISYACTRIGMVIALGLVTLRIIMPATTLPVNVDTVLYAVGVLMVGGGYLGIAVNGRRIDREEGQKG